MIDRTHDLSIASRPRRSGSAGAASTICPDRASADLALMRRIDELHLEHPFAGSRMLRDMLKRKGSTSAAGTSRR